MTKCYDISGIQKAILGVDWKLLRRQKHALLEASIANEELCGIVHLIDAIQDAAVEDGIAAEETVFGNDYKEN